jgi:hypothetical protein
MAVVLVAGACTAKPGTTPPPSGQSNGIWTINPRSTDPAISDDPQFTHLAYGPVGASRGRLAVVLHGSQGNPQAHTELAGALRTDGYHVVVLRYSAKVYTFGACPDSAATTDPDCHRAFRAETVYGDAADPLGVSRDHPAIAIDAADSVMNRLLKVIEYLRVQDPTGGWAQFQDRPGGGACTVDPAFGTCTLDWSTVAAVGHSQGSGVALYLGKYHPVAKVVMLSGSYDGFALDGGGHLPAPWVTEGLAVQSADVGTLQHTADYALGLFTAVEDAIGVTGPVTSVNTTGAPYGGSKRLRTSLASSCPWDGAPGHNSTASDLCVPDGAYVAAWRHLAGS